MRFAIDCRYRRYPASGQPPTNQFWLYVIAVAALLHVASQSAIGQELGTSDAGYIDGAIVRNQLRFRFDAAYDNPFPDRAEFFYARCGCFTNGNGPGPPLEETGVDYQEFEAYLEYALSSGFSTFVEVPFRFINPEANANASGLGDVRAGFKYAIIDDFDRWLTFQLRGYFPSGDGVQGLGTEHFSLEPGLLYQRNFDGISMFGEFKTWIPFDTSKQDTTSNGGLILGPAALDVDYSGTVTRYGIGFSYDLFRDAGVIRAQNNAYPTYPSGYPYHSSRYPLQPGYTSYRSPPYAYTQNALQPTQTYDEYQGPEVISEPNYHSFSSNSRVAAVVEVVGWTVGGGLKLSPEGTLQDATNDTIVNLKLGLRWDTPGDTLYVGYGRALTGDFWYQDIIRAEYSIRF